MQVKMRSRIILRRVSSWQFGRLAVWQLAVGSWSLAVGPIRGGVDTVDMVDMVDTVDLVANRQPFQPPTASAHSLGT